ncbi:MAG TPA: di-trans,poly-cis-decaprenylcistransferase [Dehalococcoidia bacterium]|nr:di-trans,poly-cis-decaprenylcistransferase [Dehalococcoidia bacterium]
MAARTSSHKFDRFPNHVAIVPDGNGRWAERRGWPRVKGLWAGADNMYRMVRYLNEYPIKYLTLYGFSTENWSRPEAEVSGLFELVLFFVEKHLQEIHEKDIQLRHIGRLQQLPQELQEAITRAVTLTRDNTRLILSIAFNYGGRPEIVDAARRIVTEGVRPEDITEETFSNYLYTNGIPNVDLLIRTGGENRLSNFLLWQTAYSEYHFTKVLWPDFRKKDLDRALLSYSQRKRRFGGL